MMVIQMQEATGRAAYKWRVDRRRQRKQLRKTRHASCEVFWVLSNDSYYRMDAC